MDSLNLQGKRGKIRKCAKKACRHPWDQFLHASKQKHNARFTKTSLLISNELLVGDPDLDLRL